jgi:hypothetical protein
MDAAWEKNRYAPGRGLLGLLVVIKFIEYGSSFYGPVWINTYDNGLAESWLYYTPSA